MKEVKVLLKSINDVKQFVQILTRFDGDFELNSGKYVVDAKSILGLFSVDLSKPVILKMNINELQMEEVINAIAEYVVH